MPCIDIQSPQRTQYKSHKDYNHRKNVHPEKPVIFKRKEIFKFYHVIQYIFGANLDINHDLYASAIRKNQDHPIFMALEVSVCEPQNYV